MANWADNFRNGLTTFIMGGDYTNKQQQLAFEKWKADQELDLKNKQMAMPQQVYTIDPMGGLSPVGAVVKGSKVIPPASMMTPEDKAQLTMEMGAKSNALKESQLNLTKVKRLYPIVDTVEKEWMKTNPIAESEGGRLKGLTKSALSFTQTDKDVSSYKTFVKGMRAQLARAMGDVGNLSEPEQKAAMDLIPMVGDTLEVGREKIAKIKSFISNLEQGNAEAAKALLGKDSVALPPELQKAIESSGVKIKSFKLKSK